MSSPVHFFKIILEATLQQGKLRVPKSFVKRYWEGITNPVTLTLPNTTEWKVSWGKSDGDIWLTDGWKEFAENVCLKPTHFVVFEYQETSRFNVIVFKESGLEISYPVTEPRQGKKEAVETLQEEAVETRQEEVEVIVIDDIDDDDDDDPSPSQRNNRKRKYSAFSGPASRLRKKIKTTNQKKTNTTNQKKHKTNPDVGVKSRKIIRNHLENVKKGYCPEDGMDFFSCSVQKSYTDRDMMVIPKDFVGRHLEDMKEGRKATLFVDNKENKVWDVQLKIHCAEQMAFTNGWSKFFKDHNLFLGDAVVFMLTKSKQLSFKVVVFPLETEISTPPPQEQQSHSIRPSSSFRTRNHDTPDADSRIKSKNEITIKIKRTLVNIPYNYIRSFDLQKGEFATLRVGEKQWSVKVLFYHNSKYSRFSAGWSKFAAYHGLKIGDSIHLKKIEEGKLEFQVTILKQCLN